MATFTDKQNELIINKLTKAQYDLMKKNGQIKEEELYILDEFYDDYATIASLTTYQTKYSLVNITSTTCNINNYTINSVVPSNNTTISCNLPVQTVDNSARDFIIRIDCSQYQPQIALIPNNSEQIDYESTDENWNDLEEGVNILSFTETSRGSRTVFLVGKKVIV